jgi:hypothetical protein
MWAWWVEFANFILNIISLLPTLIIVSVIMMLQWLTGGGD